MGATEQHELPARSKRGRSLKELNDALKTDHDKKFEAKVPYHTLFRFASVGDRVLLALAVVGAIAHGVSQPLFSVIFGEVVNAFGPGSSMSDAISAVAKWFVVLGAATAVATFVQHFGFTIVAHRQVYRIRKAYFAALMRQDMSWYDAQEVGALTSRINGDMVIINNGMADKVGTLIQMGAMFIGGYVVAFSFSWKMSLVILPAMPLIVGAGIAISKVVASVTTSSLNVYAAANAVAEEAFAAIRTIAAFGGESRVSQRFNEAVKGALENGKRRARVMAFCVGVFFLVSYLSFALAYWYGSTLILAGELDAGTVGTVFFAMFMGSMGIGQGVPFLQYMGSARGAAHAIFTVIDRVPPINASDPRGRKLDTVRGHVQFRNVHFTYPSRPDMPVLRGLDLEIQPGQTVALVGASGCGKSTSVGLIERFYDPVEGEVLIDGVNVKELSLPWWRAQVGLVQQEPVLFARSIKENIRYGNMNVTDEEIVEAAKRANAHDFIMRLPKQYDTLVGERGGQLSGGQKQRVAIARALVRDPKVLLLDEATSALDNKSEKIVQDALDKASVGRTTIIIAHRLSTIRNAHRIFVFDKGVIVEQGTHDELMALGGYYKDLVERQSLAQQAKKVRKAKKGASDKKKDGTVRKRKKSAAKAAEVAEAATGSTSTDLSPALSDADALPELAEEETAKETDSGKAPAVGKMPTMQVIWRTLQYAKPDWWRLGFGLFASACAGTVTPMDGFIMSSLTQVLLTSTGVELESAVSLWASMLVVLAVFTFFSHLALDWLIQVAGEKLTDLLRRMLFSAMLRQEMGWFDMPDNAPGLLGSRLSTEATYIQTLITFRLSIIMQAVFRIGVGLILSLTACWQLGLVLGACIPLIVLGGLTRAGAAIKLNDKSKHAYERASNIASECTSSIRTVASLGCTDEMYRQYHTSLRAPNEQAKTSAVIGGIGTGYSEFVLMASMGLAFWYGGRLVDPVVTPGTAYTFGNVMLAVIALAFGAAQTGETLAFIADFDQVRGAADIIYGVIDRKPPIDAYNTAGDVIDDLVGNISLRDVHFRYPTRPTMPVLRGLSLDIEPGKTTALVGSSGCGKSTIIQLLERFYDPLEGSVTIDGRDVRSLSLRWWRSQIGLVQQEPLLFAMSIGDNIRFGMPEATQEQVEAAAKLANAHDFISSLPDGYNTSVGERGAQLSGGQKQRIAIARALIRNPKLLLLDEATSALDSESEKIVQDALDVARQGRTTIMIAHRLSTVKNADMIVVIDQGVVVEKGTHDELIAKRGHYFKLVHSQI